MRRAATERDLRPSQLPPATAPASGFRVLDRSNFLVPSPPRVGPVRLTRSERPQDDTAAFPCALPPTSRPRPNALSILLRPGFPPRTGKYPSLYAEPCRQWTSGSSGCTLSTACRRTSSGTTGLGRLLRASTRAGSFRSQRPAPKPLPFAPGSCGTFVASAPLRTGFFGPCFPAQRAVCSYNPKRPDLVACWVGVQQGCFRCPGVDASW